MSADKETLPKGGKVVLWFFLEYEDYYQAVGDFEESYRYRIQNKNKTRALIWFWFMLLRSMPRFINDYVYWRGVMLKNYIKTVFRVIRRQKLYSFLNIAGLAVSLSCAFLILFHVKDELSYEKHFPKSDRIYRIQTNSKYGSNFRNWAPSAPAIGPVLEESFPEIVSSARIRDIGRQILRFTPDKGEPRRFEEVGGFCADNSFLSMFDLEMLGGDKTSALTEPHSVVLTESLARRFFVDEDPLGRTLVNESRKHPLKVTGVISDFPRNTHLRISYLVSMPTFLIYMGWPEALNHRTWKAMYTYVLFRSEKDAAAFREKAAEFMNNFHAAAPREEEIVLQPIQKIHLHSKLEQELSHNSDVAYIYIFSAAAFLLLIIAGVNFVNLSTSQSFKRMKEIGVRKVVGARKGQLVKQHLGESWLFIVLSTAFALLLLNLVLPFYNRLTGKALTFGGVLTLDNIILVLLIMILLTVLAGLYPAFFISGFQPASSIKSVKDPRSTAVFLRKGLMAFQFVISIFMIFCTITLYRQLNFFLHQDPGFDKDRLVAVRMYSEFSRELANRKDSIKTEIRRHPDITHVALTSNLFGTEYSNERLTPVSVQDKSTLPMLRFIRVDDDFIDASGLKIVKGRNFDKRTDQKGAYIINESVAAVLDLKQPLGISCRSDVHGGEAPIVGVIKDFHFASFHRPLEPFVLEYRPSWTNYMLVKVQGDNFQDVLAFLEQKFQEIAPGNLFSYVFVDEMFDRNYAQEIRALDLFKAFSVLALIVSCLGLFGMTVYSAEVRIKEIGIRKVLGASGSNIAFLLSKNFILWVLFANVVAWPLAYLAMNMWLQNFAYRVEINIWTFIFSTLTAFLIALVTLSYQAVKAALSNPVDSMRYE
ncbi:MAG: ABC transporter permease [Candidatus Aminicenantes bacterium]|nr:ABC transporter permease [Candidatus Aminicenantes bacterium]